MSPDPFAQLALDATGLQVALELLRRYSSVRIAEAGLRLSAAQLRRAIDFFQDHLATPVRLAQVAQAVGLSPFHFCRAFAASVGLSPQKYLRLLRIRQGEKLLANRRESIEATAARLGYQNPAAFTRAFKRETGLTPSAFRARLAL
jgi:AraC family transcriptional regulator